MKIYLWKLESKEKLIKEAEALEDKSLAETLKRQFSITKNYLDHILKNQGFKVSYQQMNKYVWIITGRLEY